MLNKDEFMAKFAGLGDLDDVAEIRVKLTEMSDELSGMFDEHETLQSDLKKERETSDRLRGFNNQLWTQIGSQTKQDPQPVVIEEEPKKRKYEDLLKLRTEV